MPLLYGQTKVSSSIKRPTRTVRGLFVAFLAFSLFVGVGAVGAAFKVVNPPLFNKVTGNLFISEDEQTTENKKVAQAQSRTKVLGESIVNPILQFNVPATFTALLNAASLKVSGETELAGPVITGSTLQVVDTATFDKDVIIEGNLVLGRGFRAPGATIDVEDGKVLGSNLIYKITAGDGITTSGTQELTITNSDKGSDQKIFKTIKVGEETVSAGSNTDTVTFAAGTGVTLGIDTSSKKITISSLGVDNSAAIGDRSYTGANYLTSSETVTASLLALDTAIASAGGHNAVTLAGSYDYLSLSGQQITLGQIDLATDTTGLLPITNGGTGANSLNNLITLATHTTGNYVATIADSGSSIISVTGSGSENAAVTLGIVADSLDFGQFKSALALDTSTSIALDGSEDFTITNGGTGNFIVNLASTGDFVIKDNGTTYATFADDGNVGIGTTNPAALLAVGGTSQFQVNSSGAVAAATGITSSGTITFSGLSTSGIVTNNASGVLSTSATLGAAYITADTLDFTEFKDALALDASTSIALDGSEDLTISSASTGDVIFDLTSTGDVVFKDNGTAFATFTDGGNVGIGTTAPAAKLDVSGGDIRLTNGNSVRFITGSGSATRTALSFNSNNDLYVGTASGLDTRNMYFSTGTGFYSFTTGATETMRLTSAGNLGIGTTNPASLLALGSTSQFQINSSGAVAAATGITSSGTVTFSGLSTSGLVTNNSSGVLSTTATIGAAYITADSLNFTEFSDSLSLDASTTLAQSSNTWTQSYTGTTTTGYTNNSNSLTTASAMALNVNGLTSGKGLDIQSTSTALTSGSLTNLYWNPGSATTATGDLFKIDIGVNGLLTGNILALYNNATSIFRVGTAQINSDVPHSFNASGDVGVAYDLNFTNQTASTITSLGPLTISSGEAFENNDLNLMAYGTGKINLINSGLGMQTGEKLIFDTDDSNDSYLAHSNSGNYLSIFADNTESARFKSDGAVDGNTTFNANAFDLAEYYPTKDTTVEAGDVVSIAPKNESDTAATDSPYLVEKSSPESVGQVIGVVSTKPGFALGGGSFRSEMCTEVMQGGEDDVRQKLIERELGIMSSDTTITASSSATRSASSSAQLTSSSSASNSSKLKYSEDDLSDAQLSTIEDKIQTCKAISSVPIALAGRVPVKVDLAVAKEIKAGDLLTASPTKAGTAKKATGAGWVLGRALEDYTEGNDTVMTFVFVTYYNGGSTNSVANVKPNGSPVVLSDEVGDVLGMMADSSNNVYLVSYASLNVTGDVAAANLTASSQIIAGNLTIDSTDNSITSIADSILKLQTDVNAGAVDIFNGKIIFNTDGEIITLSDIQAKMIGAEKFMIKKTKDATGKDTSSVGLATLKAGTKELQVSNPNVTISSKIFVTPRSSTKGQTLFVSSVEQEKFTVSIDTALSSDVQFDYWILGVQ